MARPWTVMAAPHAFRGALAAPGRALSRRSKPRRQTMAPTAAMRSSPRGSRGRWLRLASGLLPDLAPSPGTSSGEDGTRRPCSCVAH